MRILALIETVLEMPDEVTPLVHPGPSQVTARVVEHGIQQHDALDHPALSRRLSEAAVGFADGRPQWLVVDVEHPAAVELSRRDRRRESAVDKGPDEVGALLSVDDAGEAAVLALEEDARVQEHLQQEPRLTFREAEGGDGLLRSVLASSIVQRSGGGGSVIGSAPPRIADAPCAFRRHRVRRPSTDDGDST